MTIELPKLPYDQNALAPHISEQTIGLHYGKHHQGYVTKLNAAIAGTNLEKMSLEEIIISEKSGAIFNNAAQVFNHTFYWNSLTPNSKKMASDELLKAIESKWDSFDKFKEEFSNSAATNFGSGWTWLVKNNNGELEIINTDDAKCPITENLAPILTLDIWEHAYYLDYQNKRPDYINSFWEIVNWDFALNNFKSA